MKPDDQRIEGSSHRRRIVSKAMLISLAVYVAWVIATYVLEGRINLLLRPDDVGRVLYIVIANIIIGTILAFWALRYMLSSRFITQEQLGFRKSAVRTAVVIIAAGVGGLAIFLLQNPASTHPIVVFNVYMQVLPVSIAEVVVCWAVIGTSFESLAKRKVSKNNNNKAIPILIGAVVASVLFGVYHFAHSPPFNEVNMVLFLMIPAIAPSVVYFLGRDIYATIIIQNFLGIFGVMQTIDLQAYSQPAFQMYILTIPTIAALIVANIIVVRKKIRT
jgi:hypothetical protein